MCNVHFTFLKCTKAVEALVLVCGNSMSVGKRGRGYGGLCTNVEKVPRQ